MPNNPPKLELRMGLIKACVWANETTNGTRHNVTIVRLYKDGDSWKETSSFGRDDLPQVAEVSNRAWRWIFDEAQQQDKKEAA